MKSARASVALLLAGAAPAQERTVATYGDWSVRCAALTSVALLLAGPAQAQERTVATYGDWSVRCENAPSRNCEAGTVLTSADNQPAAQLIVGRLNNQGPVLLLGVVPLNVHLPAQLRLALQGGAPLSLSFQRCTPQACFAATELDDATLGRLRAEPAGSRMLLQDTARREIGLALSLRGFAQAQAALTARR